MTVSLSVDTSLLVDTQGADAADVYTPINELKVHQENVLNGIQAVEYLTFGSAEAVTIAADIISVTHTHVVVDTEGAAPTDDLKTINTGANGRYLCLRIASAARTVVLKHGTGNIVLASGNDYPITSVNTFVALLHNGTNWIAVPVESNQYLNLGLDSTLTIVGGAVAKTRARHLIANEAAAAADDLDTISGGVEGDVLVLQPSSAGQVVRVRHNVGNIYLALEQHRYLNDVRKSLALQYEGTKWSELVMNSPHDQLPGLGAAKFVREVAAAATFEVIGMTAGTSTGAGALTNANDDVDTYVSQAIAAVAGTFGGRRSTTFNLTRRGHSPVFEAIFKSDATNTNIRYWIGIFQAAPTNVDVLASATAALAFRYSTVAADTGWMAIANDGATQSTAVLVAAIAADTRYKVRIRMDQSVGAAFFSVNGGPEVQVSANLPGVSVDLGLVVTAITTTATAKAMRISSYGAVFARAA